MKTLHPPTPPGSPLLPLPPSLDRPRNFWIVPHYLLHPHLRMGVRLNGFYFARGGRFKQQRTKRWLYFQDLNVWINPYHQFAIYTGYLEIWLRVEVKINFNFHSHHLQRNACAKDYFKRSEAIFNHSMPILIVSVTDCSPDLIYYGGVYTSARPAKARLQLSACSSCWKLSWTSFTHNFNPWCLLSSWTDDVRSGMINL